MKIFRFSLSPFINVSVAADNTNLAQDHLTETISDIVTQDTKDTSLHSVVGRGELVLPGDHSKEELALLLEYKKFKKEYESFEE